MFKTTKKLLFILFLLPSLTFAQGSGAHITQESQHPLKHKANRIVTSTTNFNNNLGVGDTSVQNALDTIDNLTLGGDITSVGDALTGAVFATGDTDSLLGNLIGIGATHSTAYLNIKATSTAPAFILKVADTSSNDRLVIQQDGNVGIGKTNPTQKLDVSGTINATTITGANVTSGADPGHTHGSGSITEADPLAILTTGTRGLSGNWYNANYNIGTLGNIGIGNTNPVALLQAGTSPGSFTVLSTGNVGIGNTSPASGYKLEVSGNSKFSGDVNITGNLTAVTDQTVSGNIIMGNNKFIGTGTSPAGGLYFIDAGTDVAAFLNYNVGIGLTNPSEKLQISGNLIATTGTFSTLNIGSLAGILKGTTGLVSAITDSSANWDTAYTDRLKWDGGATGLIAATGRTSLELGTMATQNANAVNITAGTGGFTTLTVTGNTGLGNTAPQGLLDVGTTPGKGLIVLSSGNVGIGTTNPGVKLDVIGAMRTTDTIPLMKLTIYDPNASMDAVGTQLSTQKTFVFDKAYARISAGSNVIFTLKVVGTSGTSPTTNLAVGQTATQSVLTVTTGAGTTIPPDNLLIMDIESTLSTGTNTMYQLAVFGRENP